jgi:TM2 domain-containing membrane protein YozV
LNPGWLYEPQNGGEFTMSDQMSNPAVKDFAGKKIAAGICGILLGSLGIHKFILGLSKQGVIMLLVSLLTCGIGASVMYVIGLVEGIIYLTKTDEDFYQTYGVEKKGWF